MTPKHTNVACYGAMSANCVKYKKKLMKIYKLNIL